MVTYGHQVSGDQSAETRGHCAIGIDFDQEQEAGVILSGDDAVEVSDGGVGTEYLRVLDDCPDVNMMTHGDTELTCGGGRGEHEQLGVVSHGADLLHCPLSVGGGEILVIRRV